MKIAVVNQPMGNRGDESAHRAFIRRLAERFPNIQFDIIETVEKKAMIDSFRVRESNVEYIELKGFKKCFLRAEQVALVINNAKFGVLHPFVYKIFKTLKNYDAVICAPGGICMGGFMSWNHVYQLILAKSIGKSVFYWGRSIGPFTTQDFKHRLFTKFANQVLTYSTFISLRDSVSLNIAKEMGINAVSTVDSAFLDIPRTKVPDHILGAIGNSNYMVFVPNSLTWHYRYASLPQERIDNFYYKILDKIMSAYPNWKIVMLPQTYMSPIEDCKYFRTLASAYCEEHRNCVEKIIVVDENQSSDIQQTIISNSELVIGARYHSIVFAINNSRPFVSLSYEHKMSGLLETLELTDYMVRINDIFDDGCESVFNTAVESVAEKMKIACSTPKATEKAKRIVNSAFDQMCERIDMIHP